MVGQCHQNYQNECDRTPEGSGTGGPGVLWSMGSRRVGHDLMSKQQQKIQSFLHYSEQGERLLLYGKSTVAHKTTYHLLILSELYHKGHNRALLYDPRKSYKNRVKFKLLLER